MDRIGRSVLAWAHASRGPRLFARLGGWITEGDLHARKGGVWRAREGER